VANALRVEGLTGLRRAFKAAGAVESRELVKRLRAATEPVRASAEGRATSLLKPGKVNWSGMRIGSTLSGTYVAPRQRGLRRFDKRKSRPKLATRLLEHALEPALEENAAGVERAVDELLGDVGRVWETTF
jgi:hypothetical protein